jgi:hypothetical protein
MRNPNYFFAAQQPFLAAQHPFLAAQQPFFLAAQAFLPAQQPFLAPQQPFLPAQQPFLPAQADTFAPQVFLPVQDAIDGNEVIAAAATIEALAKFFRVLLKEIDDI